MKNLTKYNLNDGSSFWSEPNEKFLIQQNDHIQNVSEDVFKYLMEIYDKEQRQACSRHIQLKRVETTASRIADAKISLLLQYIHEKTMNDEVTTVLKIEPDEEHLSYHVWCKEPGLIYSAPIIVSMLDFQIWLHLRK